MRWSLVTLATIEAAAMAAMRASPLTRVLSLGWTCMGLPSMSTQSGSTPASLIAPDMAARSACAMPTASMTAGSMWQVPMASAASAIFAARTSRLAGVSCLESLMPQIMGS